MGSSAAKQDDAQTSPLYDKMHAVVPRDAVHRGQATGGGAGVSSNKKAVVQIVTGDGQMCMYYTPESREMHIIMRPPCINGIHNIQYTLFYVPIEWTSASQKDLDAGMIVPVTDTKMAVSCTNVVDKTTTTTTSPLSVTAQQSSLLNKWKLIESTDGKEGYVVQCAVLGNADEDKKLVVAYDSLSGLVVSTPASSEKTTTWRFEDMAPWTCTPGLDAPQCALINKRCVALPHTSTNLGVCACRPHDDTNPDGSCTVNESGLLRPRLDIELAMRKEKAQVGRMVRMTSGGDQDRMVAFIVALMSFALIIGILWISMAFMPDNGNGAVVSSFTTSTPNMMKTQIMRRQT